MIKDLLNTRPELLRATACALLLAVCSLAISPTDNPLQRWLGDLAQRHHQMPATMNKVVVVAIDNASQTELGPWPWPNSRHALLLDQLRESGARAVAFTTPLVATPPATLPNASNLDDTGLLTSSMRTLGQVILPVEISTTGGAAPSRELVSSLNRSQRHFTGGNQAIAAHPLTNGSASLLSAAASLGHTSSPVDNDDRVRRDYAAVRIGDQKLPSLSLALANLSSDQRNTMVVTDDQLQLSPTAPATPVGSQLDLRPKFSSSAINHVPYWQVLQGKFDPAVFKDKAILVGITEGAGADRVDTPVGSLPRVDLLASTTNAILNHELYRHPAWATLIEWLLAAAVLALAAVGWARLRTLHGLTLLMIMVLGFLFASYLTMRTSTATLQVVPQLAALIGAFLIHLLSRKTEPAQTRSAGSRGQNPAISMDTLKTLALTLHGQGQLDLAFETLRRCQPNRDTLDLLYRLAADYERRRELLKAAQAYRYVGELDQSYKDAAEKAQQLQQALEKPKPATRPAKATAPTSMSNISRPKPVEPVATQPASGKETLGRYEIDRQIGKGAMGVVYLGRDPKINRVVAIKAIPLADEFEDDDLLEARERFFREAEMAGRLNHPGIVTIFDAGEDHGLAYIAMEYIQGEHLSFYCEPNRLLPVRKVLTLIIRVAEALNYAHLQNVVHRDIKPANIMFNIETDALKITDFGIARLSDVSRTKTGIVLGTPSFMSPEQLEGRPLDGRSDLFGLGVSMYQMLTGQLPFRADSMTRLMNNIATEPHPPIRSLRPELPECIEQVLDRCLAKSADDRYQNGIDMADAIRNCMRGLT